VETAPAAVYQPRNPRATSLFALVEDYYEEFERVYDDRYQQQYGPWRPVIGEVMRKYLECGDLWMPWPPSPLISRKKGNRS
jgi:hypothetical protein